MTFVEKLLTALPIRGKQAQLAARIEDRHVLAKRALGYVELYGAYTETDARYRVDNLMELWDTGDADDHERFEFDPAAIDWDRYVHEIHLPSVLEHTACARSPAARWWTSDPIGSGVRSCRPNGISPCSTWSTRSCRPTSSTPTPGSPAATCRRRAGRASSPTSCVRRPSLLALDRRDRGDFLRSFYRRFEDAPIEQLRADSWELFHRQLLTQSFPDGFARVRAHRALGHRTLLITGALDFVIEPIRPLFDDIVCAEMEAHDGRLTGHLTTLPPIGEARALVLADYAEHARALARGVGGLRRLGQ